MKRAKAMVHRIYENVAPSNVALQDFLMSVKLNFWTYDNRFKHDLR